VEARVVGFGVKADALGANEERFTDERPRSARLVPDDERWNKGWLGRGMARDCLDPDMERT